MTKKTFKKSFTQQEPVSEAAIAGADCPSWQNTVVDRGMPCLAKVSRVSCCDRSQSVCG